MVCSANWYWLPDLHPKAASPIDLVHLQENWDRFGREDPLWAILSDPHRRHNQWDVDEFFASGRQELTAVFDYLSAKELEPPRCRALDFGCGVGRLTQALCERFDECDGVDIAPSMIELARQYNRQGDRCRYHVNAADDLRCFGDNSFDFIYSNLVLQHMEPRYSKKYITEFVRLLRPEGLAVFQVPGFYRPIEPLDPADHRASLTVESPTAATMRLEPGQLATLEVRVRNESGSVWPAMASAHPDICLGNHWLKRRGATFRLDDGRAGLEEPLGPRQETILVLHATAPTVAGRYLLELDMVEEGQAWFAQHGSPTVRIPVIVRGSLVGAWRGRLNKSSRPLDFSSWGAQDPGPVMELHCVPPEEVRQLVTSAGGQVADVHAYNVAGSSFESYRYIVARSTVGASTNPGG